MAAIKNVKIYDKGIKVTYESGATRNYYNAAVTVEHTAHCGNCVTIKLNGDKLPDSVESFIMSGIDFNSFVPFPGTLEKPAKASKKTAADIAAQYDEAQKKADIAAARERAFAKETTAKIAAAKIDAGMPLTVTEFEALTGVMFSHDMSGKMTDVLSISTCCLYNEICRKRMLDGDSICSECFAASTERNYKGTRENTALNGEILSASILPWECLPVIYPVDSEIVRIESFGDTRNWVQAANYIRIALKSEHTRVIFAAWSKNPGHYERAFKELGIEKPKNFIFVLSSPYKNVPATIPAGLEWLVDHVFTVYTLDHLESNGIDPETFINCGARSCNHCRQCYKRGTALHIRELEKSDAKRAGLKNTEVPAPAAAEYPQERLNAIVAKYRAGMGA